jgi:hypothetical protein
MRSRVTRILTLALILVILTAINVSASGPAGVFAVIEKVIFEPNEQAPERLQLWGAFAFVAGGIRGSFTSPPERGYLYFSIPASATPQQRETIRKEWADFKTVAGTPQGVAFGDWLYVGDFSNANNREIYARNSKGITGVMVYSSTASRPAPIAYTLNTGVVKLSATGGHAATVEQLRALLKK